MYDRELAKDAAILASHAYDEKEAFEKFVKENKTEYTPKFIHDKRTDTQCMVLIANDRSNAIVLFRGTESDEDWKTDAKADLEDVKYLTKEQRIHRGFNSVYEKVRKRILKALGRIENVEVIGHSLGGALATICAVDLKSLNPHAVITVYTFGSPRVGDKKFVKYFEDFIPKECSFRFVNGEDPVAKVPPPIEYDHVDTLYKIGQKPWRRFLRKFLRIRFMFLDIKDHFMNNYIKNI